MTKLFPHPYIPNSVPEVKDAMLNEIGVKDIDKLFEDIPDRIKLKRRLKLPKASSEYQVRKTIAAMLSKNKTIYDMPSYLGAGCWPRYVPAVVDEINGRSEFLTSYAGDAYCDLGRFQAIFEFQSMIGGLVGLDAVGWPMYDWGTVAGEAARMAARVTGRYEVLTPRTISPERLSVIRNYCERLVDIKLVDYDRKSGQLDIKDLKSKITSKTAAVYVENPSYLGFIETQGDEISKIAHGNGALSIVGVEPSSLGVLTPPGEYGADIVVGDGQPLGIHLNFGGGLVGFIACRDEDRLVGEMPSMLCTITTTQREGEYGFTWYALPERLHYYSREKGKSFTGSSGVLWGISAAVYLALLGPQGMQELAEAIMQKAHYAMKLISEIREVKAPIFDSPHFEEFTVNFDRSRKSVRNINKALLKQGIQGGKDITKEFPELGNSALLCVSEIHTKEQIDRLASALKKAVK